jgi:hypothetical protein
MASSHPPVPPHTPSEELTRSELIAAVVWLASGYQQAIDLTDSLLKTPPITTAERAIARDAIAQQRAEFSAVRVRVASVLDESARLRPVPDRRQLKAASNY